MGCKSRETHGSIFYPSGAAGPEDCPTGTDLQALHCHTPTRFDSAFADPSMPSGIPDKDRSAPGDDGAKRQSSDAPGGTSPEGRSTPHGRPKLKQSELPCQWRSPPRSRAVSRTKSEAAAPAQKELSCKQVKAFSRW